MYRLEFADWLPTYCLVSHIFFFAIAEPNQTDYLQDRLSTVIYYGKPIIA